MNKLLTKGSGMESPIIFKIGDQDKIIGENIAAFDFDWTIVKPKESRTFPKDILDWEWLRENVKENLKKISVTHDFYESNKIMEDRYD